MSTLPTSTLPEVEVTATALKSKGRAAGLVLRVEGTDYGGWLALRVRRDVEAIASSFACEVSERWPTRDQPWQIKPGAPCEILLDGDLVITGYVDAYAPSFDARSHRVEIRGRSKTGDLVDSSAQLDGGQIKGLTLPQVAEKIAKPHGITVRNEAPAGEPLPDVQIQQGESGHATVERLSRVREVLVGDDARGNLVLKRAGNRRAAGALVQGKNIIAARAERDASEQFRDIIVKAQQPNLDDRADWPDAGAGGGDAEGARAARGAADDDDAAGDATAEIGGAGDTEVSVSGTAHDNSVTRHRVLILYGEKAMTPAEAAARAAWEVRRRLGKATQVQVTVAGWRQEDGTLWDTDLWIPVIAPWLGPDRELWISAVEFVADDGGTRTELTLTLPDAFLPDAAEAKRGAKTASGKDAETKGDFWKAALSTVTGS